jgi:hypothetical protein
MSNYTLEIISHHSKFKNKALRKYYVDGIETVGAWGDEPFEIRFKNNTWQKVQVKISLDGTDILSGKPADTEVSKDMWVVNGYATLSLKAWPEDNNGGAAFVFTSADKSVAVHTHGDLSSRGIIAAAVFTEGHVESIKITPPTQQHHYHHYSYPYYINTGSILRGFDGVTCGGTASGSLGGGTFSTNTIMSNSISSNCSNATPTAASNYLCEELGEADSRGLESLVSVGAGQHVDQKIIYVTGLIKPIFTEAVRVKYMWWDDLTAKLRTETHATPQPSGFPGDRDRKNIDLKGTPRVGEKTGVFCRVEQQQQMFDRF